MSCAFFSAITATVSPGEIGTLHVPSVKNAGVTSGTRHGGDWTFGIRSKRPIPTTPHRIHAPRPRDLASQRAAITLSARVDEEHEPRREARA